MSERPLQPHQPVSPGFTLLYKGRPPWASSSPGISGRGPMADISPFSTLKNCGSSSRDARVVGEFLVLLPFSAYCGVFQESLQLLVGVPCHGAQLP